MRRNLSDLNKQEFDLIIVGGGIFGICAAWDAILRGLSVALLERGDFAHATSANCFKFVHSGIRYLQHADLFRIREYIKELNTLLRIAPHLVYPIPIVVPTYGYGRKGKGLLRFAQLLFNLITYDRNQGLSDPGRLIPRGHTISPRECLNLFPGLRGKGLTGALIFYDGQMYSPARLALSYLKSAVEAGARVANYFEVLGLLREGDRVVGVAGQDALSGERVEIQGRVVLNATGPWAEVLLREGMGISLKSKLVYSRDAYFVIPRFLNGNFGLAVQGKTSNSGAFLSRGTRHLFIVPWRNYDIIGVWHLVNKGDPDHFIVTEEDLRGFLQELNEAYPSLSLDLRDITMLNAGLVLFGDRITGVNDFSFAKRSLIIDHAKEHHLEGLITLIGVRYTTSRGVAEKAIDLVFKKLRKRTAKSKTSMTPIYGGDISCFDEFLAQATEKTPQTFGDDIMRALIHNYGSNYTTILRYINEDETLGQTLGKSNVLKAEVVHAVREEMAYKLGDVVFRRTDLGTAEYPGDTEIRVCAELMAKELGWDNTRLRNEIDEVNSAFPKF